MQLASQHFLNVRDQLLYPVGVRLLDKLWPPETPLSASGLLRQNMTCKCLLGFYLPCPGLLKPFCCSSVGLQFWHVFLLFENRERTAAEGLSSTFHFRFSTF
jgi:hypothetical protein